MLFSIRKNKSAISTLALACLVSVSTARAEISLNATKEAFSKTCETLGNHPYLTGLGIFGVTSLGFGTYIYRQIKPRLTSEEALASIERSALRTITKWEMDNSNLEKVSITPTYRSAVEFMEMDRDERVAATKSLARVASIYAGLGAGVLTTTTYALGRTTIPFILGLFKKDKAVTQPSVPTPVTTPVNEVHQPAPEVVVTPDSSTQAPTPSVTVETIPPVASAAHDDSPSKEELFNPLSLM